MIAPQPRFCRVWLLACCLLLSAAKPAAAQGIFLISRGEVRTQTEVDLREDSGWEIRATAAGDALANGAVLSLINPILRTNWIIRGDAFPFSEFASDAPTATEFATRHPPGTHAVALTDSDSSAVASLALVDGDLPPDIRIRGWTDSRPYVVAGQETSVRWDLGSVGVPPDYFLVRVEDHGTTVFASPLPGQPGALDGSATALTLPAAVSATPGRLDISVLGFTFGAAEMKSIPELRIQAARHRSTTFSLRVVDGTIPPPFLLSTNLDALPSGQELYFPLRASSGIRPLRYEILMNALPAGVSVDPEGFVVGQTGVPSSGQATLRITDLLGRSSIQTLAVATVALESSGGTLRLAQPTLLAGPAVGLAWDTTAGATYQLERSTDLLSWSLVLTINATAARLTLSQPADASTAFFRLNGPASPSGPPINPLNVSPVLHLDRTVSATMGPEGGTLVLNVDGGFRYSLTLPIGALPRRNTIEMTEIARLDGLPLSGGLIAGVELKPDGLVLDRSAVLEMTSPTDLDPAGISGCGAQGNGAAFALQLAQVSQRTITLQLWHFSLAGAGQGTAAEVAAQCQRGTGDPATDSNQSVAGVLGDCAAHPPCEPGDLDVISRLVEIFVQRYDTSIRPQLLEAVSNDAVFEQASRAWAQWRKEMGLYQLADDSTSDGGDYRPKDPRLKLQKRAFEAKNLLVKALVKGFKRNCDRCLGHDLLGLGRVWELSKSASGLTAEDWGEAVTACAEKCLRFRFHVISEIIVAKGSTIYAANTEASPKLYVLEESGATPTAGSFTFSGSGSWGFNVLAHSGSGKCAVLAAPASGSVNLSCVWISFFKTKTRTLPDGTVVSETTYAPEMTALMKAGISTKPRENRTIYCPKVAPIPVLNLFGPSYEAAHNDEAAALPGGEEVHRISGFEQGEGDVILKKTYNRSPTSTVTEGTLFELLHTPKR